MSKNYNKPMKNVMQMQTEQPNSHSYLQADVSGTCFSHLGLFEGIGGFSLAAHSVVYNEDCVEGLKRFSDNHFDLAIVDPPYGIGMAKGIEVGKWKRKIHTTKDWDDATPTAEYWQQLFRVSKNQIVWGGNYFIEYLKIQDALYFGIKRTELIL